MATQTQLRRGTAAQNNSFTGAVGELSYDTENKSVRVHDGSTAGGIKVITEAHTGSMSITTSDNLSGLIVASTDADAGVGPTVQLFRNSSSPADNDLAGNLLFVAENDASEATVYANLGAHLQDVTNGTEDGKFFINTMVAGAEKSRLFMTATETVFNEESADLDFRVESNGNAHMLFVDGGNDAVGIKTNTPATNGQFSVRGAIATTNFGNVSGDFSDAATGSLKISHASGVVKLITDQTLSFRTGTTVEGLKIDATGAVTKPLQPAFLVKPSDDQAGFATDGFVTVVLDTEIFDQASNFASNTFTSPITGRFQLNVVLTLGNVDSAASYYNVELVTSNRTYRYIFDPDFGQDAVYWPMPFSVLADMDASDTAYLRIYQASGSAQTDIMHLSTTFSGYLVA